MKTKLLLLTLMFAGIAHSQNLLKDNGVSSAPDSWLLVNKGPAWWYKTQPSPTPVELQTRVPSKSEQGIIDRAHTLVAGRPAKAFALMDGDTVLYKEFKAPADSDSMFFSFSMGKTVTAMAVGKAICAGNLKLETKASDLLPKLEGKALGSATVLDLLRMASGAAEANDDGTVDTPEEAARWRKGMLNLSDLVAEDHVSKAQRGVFSDYKPGEAFFYKETDPLTLGMMVSRATGIPWSQWIQEQVLNPMGAARSGLYVQDRQKNGMAGSGMRLRLEDWMRFALWVKRSSREQGCFGDYVMAATTTQISNPGTAASRKHGRVFSGYGYLTWTENSMAPNTAWASGYGGQRIGWSTDKNNERMVVVFSNLENWMPDVYDLAKDWNKVSR
jgi:CubicO group peptidase (beta-lactamase class C family)